MVPYFPYSPPRTTERQRQRRNGGTDQIKTVHRPKPNKSNHHGRGRPCEIHVPGTPRSSIGSAYNIY